MEGYADARRLNHTDVQHFSVLIWSAVKTSPVPLIRTGRVVHISRALVIDSSPNLTLTARTVIY